MYIPVGVGVVVVVVVVLVVVRSVLVVVRSFIHLILIYLLHLMHKRKVEFIHRRIEFRTAQQQIVLCLDSINLSE